MGEEGEERAWVGRHSRRQEKALMQSEDGR